MNYMGIKALFKKELADILRDKKTLFTMVVIPLVLYPLLIIGLTLLMSSVMANQKEQVYKIAFDQVPETEQIMALLEEEEVKEDVSYKLVLTEVSDVETALSAGEIDAYVTYVPKEEGGFVTDEAGVKSLNGRLKIVYYEANERSVAAQNGLEDLLNVYQERLRSANLKCMNLDEDIILYPMPYTVTGISTIEDSMGSMMGSTIPMMIIVCIMMGALYPSIDVTAGEKERGTLETLLTLPITNFEMIMSKFLAVSVISCVSAVLNILSMGGACIFMVTFMTDSTSTEVDILAFLPAMLLTIVVMMAFALFVTAVCMCVCVFAKSFKEANNYITPVMFVFMFGGFASMVPNLELTATTAAVPIINVALLIEQIFKFEYDYALIGIVFITNVVYSLLTIMALGKIYNSEEILFSESLSGVKLIKKRSEMTKGQIPGIGDSVLLCCIVLLCTLYIGTAAQVKLGFAGVAVTQAFILVCPLIYAWYIKTDFKKLFSLKVPKVTQLFGAFFTWIGTYCIVLFLSMLLSKIMPESAANVNATFSEFTKQPFLILALVMALMPAVGEELLFRGFFFGALKEKMKPMAAMLVVSAVFGIYHMSLIKFFTTAFLGFMIVYVVKETGSIYCGMLMHFCNNLVSAIAMKYYEKIENLLPILVKEKWVVSDYLLLAAIGVGGILLGYLFVCYFPKKKIAKTS